MRQVYLRDRQETSDGTDVTISDDPVDVGKVLVARNIATKHDNQATTEAAVIRMTNGGQVVNLYEGLPPVTAGFVNLSAKVVVSEGWWIEGYLANAADTEVMYLDITGELYDIDTYRQAKD